MVSHPREVRTGRAAARARRRPATRRRIAAAALGALLVGMLSACVPPARLWDKEVVGAWVSETDAGRVEFFEDGHFTMSGVPSDVLDPFEWDDSGGRAPRGEPVDGTGTWQNLRDGDDVLHDPRLLLFFDSASNPEVTSVRIYTFADSTHILLGVSLGDPDRHNFYTFVRDFDSDNDAAGEGGESA